VTIGPLAQLAERFYGIEEVTGSNPVRSTKFYLRDCFKRSWDTSPKETRNAKGLYIITKRSTQDVDIVNL
jgi:hypothetical protein